MGRLTLNPGQREEAAGVFVPYNNKRDILDFRGIKNEKSKQKKRRRGYAETSQEILYPAE
jgi:hypothetical protein